MDRIHQAHSALREYIERENYQGYDPYDALNSSFTWLTRFKWPSVILIQVLKRLPINIRPLLGIRKSVNPKALGLMLSAHCFDYERTRDELHKQRMDTLFDMILAQRSKGWKNYCWGYDFKWASPVKTLEEYSPTIVVSGFISRGIRAYCDLTQKPEALEVLKSIGRFADEDLPKLVEGEGTCISYSTVKKDLCHNASLLAGEVFAALYALTKDESYKEKAYSIALFSANAQNEDGSWAYSKDIATGKVRVQTDFHQGYVIDSLKRISKDIGVHDFDSQISKGLDFYFTHQFSEQGKAYWRLPEQWPSDIHHQAQGVITAAVHDSSTAKNILNYTIKHFQLAQGAFAFRKHRLITNRITYMRWAYAWMYLAMSTYLYHESKH